MALKDIYLACYGHQCECGDRYHREFAFAVGRATMRLTTVYPVQGCGIAFLAASDSTAAAYRGLWGIV